MRLLEKIKHTGSKAIVLDGGLATTLEQAGCNLNSTLWSSEVLRQQPEEIYKAHQAFVDAGAEIILTSTYQASAATFLDIGLTIEDIDHIYNTAIETVYHATTTQQVIVGSLGPYGSYLSDGSEYTGDYNLSNIDYYQFHQTRIDRLVEKGIVDFVFETVPNFNEIKALVEFIIPKYPTCTFWISVTVNAEGDLSDGTPFDKVCEYIALHHNEVPVFGINCSHVSAVNKALDKGLQDLPQTLALYPNGGAIYDANEKIWQDEGDTSAILESIPTWISKGVTIIGGCCQTTPEDIKQIAKLINE